MDRETLIAKIKSISEITNEEIDEMTDEELLSFYQYLEDKGNICDYSD